MKHKYLIGLVILLLLPMQFVKTQNFELKTLSHYQQLLPQYQTWLDNNGLGTVLQSDSLELRNDKLHLIIQPRFATSDSAKFAWQSLDATYNSQHQHELGEILYFNAVNAFEVIPPNIVVEVLDDYDTPCLWVELSYDTAKRQVIKRESICRTKSASFAIDLSDINNKTISINPKNNLNNRKQLYKAIFNYAEEVYAPKGEDVEIIKERGKGGKLVFKVIGLRQEVLKNEYNHWIASTWNWIFSTDYDWRRVEILEFTISYAKIDEQAIEINCDIDGRYGSGYYNTTDWDKCTPMDPEFGWYLETYTNQFVTKIETLLTN